MLWIKMRTESQGRLPTYLLVGGSGLKVVHACSFFFFFFFFKEKKMSIRHAYQWSQQMRISVVILNLDMLPRGLMDLKFGRTS